MAKKKARAKRSRAKVDPAKKRLTGKESLFVARYTAHWNGGRAVREAGYRVADEYNYAYTLIRKPHILNRIEAARADVDSLHEDIARKATRFLDRQLNADPRAMFDKEGIPIPVHELGDAEATLLRGTEHQQETVTVDGKTVTRLKLAKVRIADQRAAAEAAHKLVDKWREKAERRHPTMPAGTAEIDVNKSESGELDIVVTARRIAFVLAQGAAKAKASTAK